MLAIFEDWQHTSSPIPLLSMGCWVVLDSLSNLRLGIGVCVCTKVLETARELGKDATRKPGCSNQNNRGTWTKDVTWTYIHLQTCRVGANTCLCLLHGFH